MREIKFRAWDRKAKVMFPVHEMKFGKISNKLDSYYGVDIHDKDSDFYGVVSYGGSIYKKTGNPLLPKFELMQYTGLNDKNGKEIYEGDFVKGTHRIDEDWTLQYQTIFRNGCFMFGGWNTHEFFNKFQNIEIIGNIYENPELIKEERQCSPKQIQM